MVLVDTSAWTERLIGSPTGQALSAFAAAGRLAGANHGPAGASEVVGP